MMRNFMEYDMRISQETREKISKKLKGISKSQETKNKMRLTQQERFKNVYKLSKIEINNLIYDYTINRKTIKECMQKYNISKTVATKYLKNNNVHIRTNSESHQLNISKELRQSVIDLYKSGKTISQVSKKLNLKRCSVYNIIIQENCSRGRYPHDNNPKKRFTTMKERGNYTSSKPENQAYEELVSKYGKDDVIRQYRDERYPFACDFYIKSKDLFIELNAHWSHGCKPYDENDKECQDRLKVWQEKAKTSKFYQQAIYTWTDLDVRKRKCAKDNNLNYLTIY